jgi:tetratricopeptide (TPR) repeat protein
LLLLSWVALGAGQFAAAETPPMADDASLRQRIAGLIDQLGDDRFSVREAAQAELAKIGPEAFDALTIAENHPDLEIAARAHYLLGMIDFQWVRDDDPPEVKQALGEYERLDAEGRRARIQKLGEQPSLPQIMALCRLVRFEKSHVLSKEAALAIMNRPVASHTDFDHDIIEAVASSPRPAAGWLRAFVLSHSQPEAAVKQWTEIIAREEIVLEQTPEQSRPEIVTALLKRQVDQLERLNRTDEALATMRRVVAQETGQTQTLVELMHWLVEHKAWQLLGELEQRFGPRFQEDAVLLYSLAEAQASSGNEAQARHLADRAFGLNAGDAGAHVEVAQQLHKRGLDDWAQREFRYVIELGPPESLNTLNAQFILGEMLHDQLRDLEAAQLLESCLRTLEKAASGGNNKNGVDVRRLLEAIRGHTTARLHYYYACHWNAQGEHKKELEHLEKGIEADPLDADILILLYRLPDQSDEQRQKTEGRIAAAARQFRNQIAQNPRDANGYNQLAWLLSNTDRDQEEALRCSLESLKLRPNEAGLLDTLGRCYYALGDYENAVKQQAKAVALEPHSGVMKRQFDLFQKALAEKQAKAAPK